MSQNVTTLEQLEQIITDLTVRIDALEEIVTDFTARIDALEASNKPQQKSQKEMTDEDARNILIGDCKNLKHTECVTKLGLSYGQIYSCRGEYTFRHIHKEIRDKDPQWVNPWKKK